MQTLYLRHYLRPGGVRPYDQLPDDLEAALAKGEPVSLVSVPGFPMLMGLPGYEQPWVRGGRFYTSAAEALAAR
jgi:hypothetical protein